MRTFLLLTMPLTITFILKELNDPGSNLVCLHGHPNYDSIIYKVYKIDSINSYYIIYAKSGSAVFKIVTSKESAKNCNKIVVDKSYEFHLHSVLSVNGESVIPANQINEVTGFRIDNITTISLEGDSIMDLFFADNIKGLCYIK